MSKAARCKHRWERRTKGRMYVNARGHCKRLTAHPSGYCSAHRYQWRGSVIPSEGGETQ